MPGDGREVVNTLADRRRIRLQYVPHIVILIDLPLRFACAVRDRELHACSNRADWRLLRAVTCVGCGGFSVVIRSLQIQFIFLE